MSKKVILITGFSLFFLSCMHTEHKIQTLWEQVLQSQSAEEERANIDKFASFLKQRNLSFKAWQHSNSGEKTLLNNPINANQKSELYSISLEVFINKSELKIPIWKPKATDNVWRLYFE